MTRWSKAMIRYCLLLLLSSLLPGCLEAARVASSPVSSERNLKGVDGRLQVRSQSGGGATRIEWLSPSGEPPSATLELPAEVVWLGWHPSGDLLLVTTELHRYSFGANYKVELHRWSGRTSPSARPLVDATLKPLTLARWEPELKALSVPVLGPQMDVLAFLRLHDPPAFDPYLNVVLISLAGEGEMVLGSQAMPGAPLAFAAHGETLRWTGGDGRMVEVHPWLGPAGVDAPQGEAVEAVEPALLHMRQLLLQGLLSQDDYRQQWRQRRQP